MLKLISDEEIQKAWKGESVEPLAYGGKRIVTIYDPHKVAQAQLEADRKAILDRARVRKMAEGSVFLIVSLEAEEYQQLKENK